MYVGGNDRPMVGPPKVPRPEIPNLAAGQPGLLAMMLLGLPAMSATPGSRLSDDLYSLYLAGLGWVILPFYGDQLAEVLPSDYESVDRGVDLIAIAIVAAAIWGGWRGGPVLVSRAGVIHELASGASTRKMLYPRLLRQVVARSAMVAVASSLGLALSLPGDYSVGQSVRVSIVLALAVALATCQSMLWHVLFANPGLPNVGVALTAIIGSAGPIAVVALGGSFFAGPGLGVLGGLALASVVGAVLCLEQAPIDRLWARARALETLRSSMQTVDFQKMLLDVRSVSDSKRSLGLALARPFMPTPVWRQVSALQHGLAGQLMRLVSAGGLVAVLVRYADLSQGIVALTIAGALAVIGVDLAVPIAATADQIPFLVHYRNGSGRVLQGQMFTAVVLGLAIGAVVTSGLWASGTKAALGALLLAFVATLAALMQARLGSPDVGSWAANYGPSFLGPMLWIRALSGPVLLVLATISISHQYFRPDSFASSWLQLTALIALLLAAITSNPLEKSLR